MAADRRFVKSGDTRVPVANSRAELERVLRRYGCSHFGVQQEYGGGRVVISFVVPDDLSKDAPKVPVRLDIEVRAVYDALYGRPTRWAAKADGTYGHVHDAKSYRDKEMAQAERVAWRQLILWVDAALSAAAAGVQRISEAFLAHTLVRGVDGQIRRMTDQLDQIAGGNWRALLPPPEAE